MKMSENKRDVWDVLDSLTFSIKLCEPALRSDRIFLEILEEGIAENNIDKIYEFIEAMERGGHFPYSKDVHDILNKAYEEDSKRLFKYINVRNNVCDYWDILIMLNNKEAIYEFSLMDGGHPGFYYECARQLLNNYYHENEYAEPCARAIVNFAEQDQELWRKWITKNEYNVKWEKIVGMVLSELDDDSLLTYAQTINLKIPMDNNIYVALSKSFLDVSEDIREGILKCISKVVFERWNKTLYKCKIEDKFRDRVFVSLYVDFILLSLDAMLHTDELWEDELTNQIALLKKDYEAWASSLTEFLKNFFLNLTQIYLLLFVKENKVKSERVLLHIKTLKAIVDRHEHLCGLDLSNNEIKKLKELLENKNITTN